MTDKTIRCDIQTLDRYGRLTLTSRGAREDMARFEGQLKPCEFVKIDGGDIEVLAVLDFDCYDGDRKNAKEWLASPIWSTTKPR
jgi:hypothetical protein